MFQISPAQKDPKQKRLSDNVKKFMESKVGEQKAKEKEDESKRKNLLQLRSENKKSQRFILIFHLSGFIKLPLKPLVANVITEYIQHYNHIILIHRYFTL